MFHFNKGLYSFTCTENKSLFFFLSAQNLSQIKKGSMILSDMMTCRPDEQQHLQLMSFQPADESNRPVNLKGNANNF